MNTLNFVIVGHVDHGKSTLIGRLLYDTNALPTDRVEELKAACNALGRELEFSFITDHLQEEREQNVTIDTTQIKFKTQNRDYTIIDAPGHKEFLKNMMTGASQAEAAALIVDAKEGVQEQTRRHASIIALLGIKQVVVLLNKMDLVEFSKERFDQLKAQTETFFKTLDMTPAHIIPIVAKDGDNCANPSTRMQWYSGLTFLEALDQFTIKEKPTNKPLRYSVQDVYKVGEKRILVGRVEAGVLKSGQKITFLPSNKQTVVKTIEAFGNEGKKEAEAGECIGITISDPLFIERGEIASAVEQPPMIAQKIVSNVFWFSSKNFEKKDKITIKLATQEASCRVEQLERIDSSTFEVIEHDATQLCPTEIGRFVLIPEKPIVIEDFNEVEELGRFVLELNGEAAGGGIVV